METEKSLASGGSYNRNIIDPLTPHDLISPGSIAAFVGRRKLEKKYIAVM